MAVQAVATVVAVGPDSDTSTTFSAEVYICTFGANAGTLGATTTPYVASGLDPTSITLKTDIANNIKTFLVANGVTFGLLDTVAII